MKQLTFVAVLFLAACGGTGSASRSAATPVLSGDACALHQDATSCRDDAQGCLWYPNTRVCEVGAPCPAGWCSSPGVGGGGTGGGGGGGGGGGSASAGCACPGAGGDACVMEIGGPALQQPPSITCAPVPAGCALPDRCGCLSGSTAGTCAASQQVTNLCVCDDGVR